MWGNKEKYSRFYALSLGKKELERQVRDYDKLRFYQSARGVPILMLLAVFTYTLLLTQLIPGLFILSEIIFGIIIYTPLLFLTYRSHRFAMVGLLALYTYDKWYIFILFSSFSSLFWWLLIGAYLYRALQVENRRKKEMAAAEV